MNYAGINFFDIANGKGVRASLFVSGCQFHCKECFNPETWDYGYGKPYTKEVKDELVNLVANPNIDGLSILGGDPLWQSPEDIEQLIELVREIKSLGKSIWIWSGFVWETIMGSDKYKLQQELVKACDVWVDGRFEIDRRDLRLKWRGSANQRVIDVKKSVENDKVILLED